MPIIISWVINHWQAWLVFIVISFGGYIAWVFLMEQRTYKMVDGKLYVRHGKLGKWIDVEQHLKEDHREETK